MREDFNRFTTATPFWLKPKPRRFLSTSSLIFSATTGSMRAARHAGTTLARLATTSISTAAAAMETGSAGAIWNTSPRAKRPRASAAPSPKTTPMNVSTSESVSTFVVTERGCAPSARRRPISRVWRATV